MFRRGGSAIHSAEKAFIRDLVPRLSDEFIVVANSTLDTGRADFDLDATIIGPMGVVIVELKSWAGAIEVQPGGSWIRERHGERKPVRSPLRSVQLKQRRFHSLLFEHGMMHVSVVGIVALHGNRYSIRGPRELRRHVVPASRVADHVMSRRHVFSAPNVRATTMSERLAIAGLLASRPASGAPVLHGYEFGPLVDSNAQEKWFEYAGTEVVTRRKVRARVRPDCLAAEDGAAELREAQALSLIYNTHVLGHLLTCPDPDHDDTLITITEDLPGTWIEEHMTPDRRPRRDVARDWLRGAFVGLNACHESGVINRNIHPRSIRIVERRGPVLTGFGRARVVGLPTIAELAFPPSPYTAPELHRSLRPATPGSDLYSMARVFAALADPTAPFDAPVDRARLASEYGDAAAAQLERCLEPHPNDRPLSAREVLIAIDGR